MEATRPQYVRWFTAALAVLFLVACADVEPDPPSPDAGNPAVVLRAAHAQPTGHVYETCGYEVMNDHLADNPDANLSIEVFGGAQLGSNEESMELLQAGNLDLTLPGIGSLTIFDPAIGALETAFAFEDVDEVQDAVDSPAGRDLIEPLREEQNHRVLGPLWPLGSRHITANVPITSPADLTGLSMRTQDTAASLATAKALGAAPNPIDLSELYLGLSQGVVDAQENPLVQISDNNFDEVQDYLMLTGHIINVSTLLMAESTYNSLSAEQQQVLEEAAEIAAAEVTDCIAAQEEEVLAEWRAADSPIEVIEPEDIDMEAFHAHAEELYTTDPAYADMWGDLYLEFRDG